LILHPWGYTTTVTEKDALLREIASRMSEIIKKARGTVYEYGQAGGFLYLTNGDTIDWSFASSGIPSYTIELPPLDELHGGFFNAEEEINGIFQENLPALLYLIEWSVENFKHSRNSSQGDN